MAPRDAWFTARASNEVGNCVETYVGHGAVRVRDSKARHTGTVTFTHNEWRSFVDGLRGTPERRTP